MMDRYPSDDDREIEGDLWDRGCMVEGVAALAPVILVTGLILHHLGYF